MQTNLNFMAIFMKKEPFYFVFTSILLLTVETKNFGMQHEFCDNPHEALKIVTLIGKKIEILQKIHNSKGSSQTLITEAKKLYKILDDGHIRMPVIKQSIDQIIATLECAIEPTKKLSQKYQFTPERIQLEDQLQALINFEYRSERDIVKCQNIKKKFEEILCQAKKGNYESTVSHIELELKGINNHILFLNQENLKQKKVKLRSKVNKRNKNFNPKKLADDILISKTKISILAYAQSGDIEVLRHQLTSKIHEERKTALETVDKDGNNALHIAAQAGNKNTVAFLLTCPFDPLAENKTGKTARILAKENDHAETAAILTKAEEAARAVKKAADQKKEEVKQEVEQDESKQNSKNKRKAKRAAQKAKKEQAAFEVEVAQKKEKEQREEEVQEKERAAQEKHEQELRAYFHKAVAEDDDENWTKMLLPIRIPTQCIIRNGIRYMPHASERMAPDTPKVRAKLEKRALAKGLQRNTEAFEKYVQPRGISFEEVEQAISHPDHTASHSGAHIYRRGRLKLVTKMLEDMVTVITAVWEQ